MIVTEIGGAGATASVAEVLLTMDAHVGIFSGGSRNDSFCTLHTYVFAVDTRQSGKVATGEVDWFPPLFGEHQGDYMQPLLRQDLAQAGVYPLLETFVSAGSGMPAASRSETVARRATHPVVFSQDSKIFTCSVYYFCGTSAAHLYTRGSAWAPRPSR